MVVARGMPHDTVSPNELYGESGFGRCCGAIAHAYAVVAFPKATFRLISFAGRHTANRVKVRLWYIASKREGTERRVFIIECLKL